MNEKEKKTVAYLKSLRERAEGILAKSAELRCSMDKIADDIDAFNVRYSDEEIDNLDWEGREQVYAVAAALFERMRVVEERLVETEAEYVVVCQEVNELYGKEVLPPLKKLPPDTSLDFLNSDLDDADWWKNQ